MLVTDLCTMQPDAETNEFEVVTLHPGVTREQVQQQTGWPVRFRAQTGETPAPTESELATAIARRVG